MGTQHFLIWNKNFSQNERKELAFIIFNIYSFFIELYLTTYIKDKELAVRFNTIHYLYRYY